MEQAACDSDRGGSPQRSEDYKPKARPAGDRPLMKYLNLFVVG